MLGSAPPSSLALPLLVFPRALQPQGDEYLGNSHRGKPKTTKGSGFGWVLANIKKGRSKGPGGSHPKCFGGRHPGNPPQQLRPHPKPPWSPFPSQMSTDRSPIAAPIPSPSRGGTTFTRWPPGDTGRAPPRREIHQHLRQDGHPLVPHEQVRAEQDWAPCPKSTFLGTAGFWQR